MLTIPKLCPPTLPAVAADAFERLEQPQKLVTEIIHPYAKNAAPRPKKPRLVLAASARVNTSQSTSPEPTNTDDDEYIAAFSEGPHSTEPSSAGGRDSGLSDGETDMRRASCVRSNSSSAFADTSMRQQSLASDRCVVAMTSTAVKCGLCEHWFQLGPEYKNLYNWTSHKRKCPYRALQSMFQRPLDTPVEFLQSTTESIQVDDPDAERWRTDPRVRDFNFLKVQCDRCGIWRLKESWESHRCRWQQQDFGDDTATETTAVASTSERSITPDTSASNILAKLPQLVSFPDSEPPVVDEPTHKEEPTLCERLLSDVKLNTFDAEPTEIIDYAERYARYLDPEPSPHYSFQYSGRPIGGLHLQPASFDDSDDDESDSETPSTPRIRQASLTMRTPPAPRALSKLDVDVMLEGTTRLFLTPHRKPQCRIPDEPKVALALPLISPDTVGMSIRQLVAARISPFTF